MKNLKAPVGVSYGPEGIQLLELVKAKPRTYYRAPMLDKPLTRIQAIDLALLLIKAAQS